MNARQEEDVLTAVETLRELRTELVIERCKEWAARVDRALKLLEPKPAGRTIRDLTRDDLVIMILFKTLVGSLRTNDPDRPIGEIKQMLDESFLLVTKTLGVDAPVVLAELDLSGRYDLAADRFGLPDGSPISLGQDADGRWTLEKK